MSPRVALTAVRGVTGASHGVMRATHIRQALAFDDDFIAAGFTLFEG